MKNQDVADIFFGIAKILEINGDNPFRIRAYEKAGRNIEELMSDVKELTKKDQLTELEGIGKDLAAKIKEIVSTGKLEYYEQLKKQIPSGLLAMLEIPGIGPKTVKLIYDQLGIDNIDALAQAASDNKLVGLPGIQEKVQDNILRGIEFIRMGKEKILLNKAWEIAYQFIAQLKQFNEVKMVEAAGSIRRWKETVRDIDLLVVSSQPDKVMKKFVSLPLVNKVLACGKTKSAVLSGEKNIQVDLRLVEEKSFGAAWLYFTGSKEFNIKLRHLALNRGYKINEYGVFTQDREKWLAGKTEQEIFSSLGMAYILPQLREDKGEIEAALSGKLPQSIELKDIKGDFHVHSLYSDGFHTIEEMVNRAVELGYQYIGISDHSQSLKVANGLDEKRVYQKIEAIRQINKKIKGIKILCGTEVDINSEGKLDYPDSLLKEFDYVIAAIHIGFKYSMAQQTKRIISACKNKYVNIIAHLSGRLIGIRPAYEVDLAEILSAAKDHQVALEINCFPERLDLTDSGARQAKQAGVKIVLGSDSHKIAQLPGMIFGVNTAVRGWIEKQDVVNCWEFKDVAKWLKK